MVITSIDLKNYRNYRDLHLDLHPEINVFYGDNAQGKTNILESAYVCATAKSHRGSRDKEIIEFGENESHIKLMAEKDRVPVRIDMHLRKNGSKGIAVNGIPLRKTSELFGVIHVVFFSPEDLSLVKNGPAERRRFINMELCQLSSLYVHNLIQYSRSVLQRNQLLKDSGYFPETEALLDTWDEQLIRYGTEIIRERGEFIRDLSGIVGAIHSRLSGGKEEMEIRYEPDCRAEAFAMDLANSRSRDIRMKTTCTGPHRDDISFYVNGVDIRKYGSQGQQRTAALSLKLAEIELVKRLSKDEPILLLDDVLSELDSGRQDQLLSAIQNTQTLITCTGLEDFISRNFRINRVFEVREGTVRLAKSPDSRGEEPPESLQENPRENPDDGRNKEEE